MNICEHLANPAKIFPDQSAIVFDSWAVTYEQLNEQSIAAAARLQDAGVVAGDRVALMLPNVPAFAVWYYGALRIGAIAVSLSTRLAASEVAFVVEDCGPDVMVASESSELFATDEMRPEGIKKIFRVSDRGDVCDGESLWNEADSNQPPEIYNAKPDEPALILYTSGTTGFPKGATLSHGNVHSNVCAFNHLCGMSHDDVILVTVPLFHCFGQNALLNSGLNAGATLVLQKKFDPQQSKSLIREHGVTQLYGVPTMFQMLNDCCTTDDLSSVYYCFTAATTMPPQVAQRWQETYKLPIYEGYGLTETSPFASYNHRMKFVLGSIGAPIDNVEMRIVDSETKQPVAAGELGEIAISGPNVMLGYWNRPEETAAAIVDGWFLSGDIGRVDEEGYFYIVDRVKDMISIGGLKVFPAEVERVLLDHSGVAEVAVVGFSGGVLGEEVVAFVVAADSNADVGTLMTDLKSHARTHLANYKTPRHIFLIESLPRNPSGKVLKTELRSREKSLLSGFTNDDEGSVRKDSSANSSSKLRELLEGAYPTERKRVASVWLQEVVCQITGDDQPVETDHALLESGLDSLMLVELSHQLQVELGEASDVSATVIFDHPTIGELAGYLIEQIFSVSEGKSQRESDEVSSNKMTGGGSSDGLESEIAAMSEEQVLEALLKELD